MTYRLPYIRLFMLLLPFALSGCVVTDWANQHMPVIGERCDNWQCFTESGREQSKRNLEQEQVKAAASNSAAAPADAAATSPAPSSQPPASPMPPQGAYKYVPRQPAPPGTTPFDGPVQ